MLRRIAAVPPDARKGCVFPVVIEEISGRVAPLVPLLRCFLRNSNFSMKTTKNRKSSAAPNRVHPFFPANSNYMAAHRSFSISKTAAFFKIQHLSALFSRLAMPTAAVLLPAQYYTFNAGTRRKNQFFFSFRLNGIGSFGTEQFGQGLR